MDTMVDYLTPPEGYDDGSLAGLVDGVFDFAGSAVDALKEEWSELKSDINTITDIALGDRVREGDSKVVSAIAFTSDEQAADYAEFVDNGVLIESKRAAFLEKASRDENLELALTLMGVNTGLDVAQQAAASVMNETGRMVIATNNPTEGVLLDVLQTGAQKAGLYGELSQTFERNITDLLDVSQSNLLVVAHSQGTEVAGNVLGSLNPEYKAHIDYMPLGVASMAVPEGLASYRAVVNPLDYVTQATGGMTTYRANFYGKDNYSVETSTFTNFRDFGHGFDSYLQQDKVKELFKTLK